MTAFDLQFASAFRAMLLHHGERVVYMPRDGAPRTITALVQRNELQGMGEQVVAPVVMVEALSDPADEDYGGIDPETVDTGGDAFRLAWEQGGTVEKRHVSRRIPSDGGVVRLEVR